MECISVAFAPPSSPPDPSRAAAASDPPPLAFHDVLSALNPLQYVPVVGNIYRAATGDVVPEPERIVGSFILSGLAGGPIGLAINAVVTAMEKVTGVDLDHITDKVLASVGIGGENAPAPSVPPWTEAQRAAYGLPAPMPSSFTATAPAGIDPVQNHAAAAAYARAAWIEPPTGGHG